MKLTKSKLKEIIREELLTERNDKLEKMEKKIYDDGHQVNVKYVTKAIQKLVGKKVRVVGLMKNNGPGKITRAEYPLRAGGNSIEYVIELDNGYIHAHIGNSTGRYVEFL